MINIYEVVETNNMIEKENLDVRTITLGISLLDCIDSDLERCRDKIYQKITTLAKDLVATGQEIEREYAVYLKSILPKWKKASKQPLKSEKQERIGA